MKTNNTLTPLWLILAGILVFVVLLLIRTCLVPKPNSEPTVINSNNNDAQEKFWKDEIDRTNIKYNLIADKYKESVIENEELKSVVKEYKKKLKSKGTSATTISSTTTIKDEIPLIISTAEAEEECPDLYDINVGDEWYTLSGTINFNDETFNSEIVVKNRYDVIIGDDRTFIDRVTFKPKKMYAHIINHNPHTDIDNFKIYKKPEEKGKGWRIAGRIALFAGGIIIGNQITK